MSDFDLGWATGLFEGEGTITLKKSGQGVLTLQLSSVDEDVVRRFQDVVSVGNVHGPYGPYQENRQPFWKWSASGEDADHLLRLLLPGLGVRRAASAQAGIEAMNVRRAEPFYAAPRTGVGGRPTHKLVALPECNGNCLDCWCGSEVCPL